MLVTRTDENILAQIIETLLILLNQCHPTYRQSVPTFFRDDEKTTMFRRLLTELSQHKQGTYTREYIEKVADKYASHDNLFPRDELI